MSWIDSVNNFLKKRSQGVAKIARKPYESLYGGKPNLGQMAQRVKPILQQQYSPKAQLNRIGNIGVLPSNPQYSDAPWTPLREFIKPKSYLGGQAGKSIAATIEGALPATIPLMGGGAPQLGKIKLSAPGALKGGLSMATLNALLSKMKGEKIEPTQMIPSIAMGAVFGGLQPKGSIMEAERLKGKKLPKSLEPLAQEARKYKSAEEYVNAIIPKDNLSSLFERLKGKLKPGQKLNTEQEFNNFLKQNAPKEYEQILANEKRFTQVVDTLDQGVQKANNINIRTVFKNDPTLPDRLKALYTQATKGVEGVGEGAKMAVPKGRISSPLAEPATKLKVQPLESILKQKPRGGGLPSGQAGLSSAPIIADPVQKIIEALKVAKPLEKQQGRIYSKIRGQQAGAIAGIGKNVPGEKGFHTQLKQLKGEMPKVEFESIRKQIGQPDIDSLFNKVEQANLAPFEKITAKSGLAKLLGAEGGSVPVQSELKLLNEVFPPEFIQAVLDRRSTMQKLFSAGVEALNLPRAMMATADMSAPLRQGVFLIGRPKQFLSAFKDQFKYFFNEKAYQGLANDIKARPTYRLMRENKLALTDTSPMLQGREEMFMSNLAEKIPGFGKVAKASNRAYSGFLNKLRADVFDDLVKNAKKLGIDKERPEVMGDIAKFVNAATGRGNLGALERSAPVLNGVFFSPRLMASRLNLMNPRFYIKLDPFVRKEALKSLFTFVGTGMTVLTLAKLGGAEVGTDPRSSDFGKIKIGNTRLDTWGGFQQYARAAGQLISGKYVSSTTGKEYTLGEGYKPLTRLGILGKVISSKESPVASFISQLLTGQSALGDKLDVPEEIINRFIPMGISSMYDLYKEGGLKEVGLGLPSIFGVGVQTYGKQIPNLETTPAGKQVIKLKPVPGIGKDILNKIRGTQPSNIPLERQLGIVTQMQGEQQKKIKLDKLKQDLESGKVPTVQTGTADLDTAKLMLKYSDQPSTKVGNTFLYKDGDTIKTLDLTFPLKDYTPTGNATLDKEYLADYKGSITTAKNNVMKALEFGAITQDEAITKLEELVATANKTKAPKKPKKITAKKLTIKGLKMPKSAKIKITPLKPLKLKPITAKKLKFSIPKLAKVKIKKTKVLTVTKKGSIA